MKFLLGLMNLPAAAPWTMAYAEISEALYQKLLNVRAILQTIPDGNSIDLIDEVHVFGLLGLEDEHGVPAVLLSEETELILAEQNYLRLPDEFELPGLLADPYDEHVCRTSFCELVVMEAAIHWRIYPKHFDNEFDT